MSSLFISSLFFFFTATSPPEIYTLSLHDALPISSRNSAEDSEGFREQAARRYNSGRRNVQPWEAVREYCRSPQDNREQLPDRKSTRLNSSHRTISYAVFCLKKKNTKVTKRRPHNK